jgi:hypothetical protein
MLKIANPQIAVVGIDIGKNTFVPGKHDHRQRRCTLPPDDERSRYRADHLERDGRRHRHWRRLLERARLCRLARHRAATDLDRRSDNPRQVMPIADYAEWPVAI